MPPIHYYARKYYARKYYLLQGKTKPVTYYHEIVGKQRGFVYPPEVETKLIMLCAGGDSERVREVLDYLTKKTSRTVSLTGK